MSQPAQARSRRTRNRLIAAAEDEIAAQGFEGLRVDAVVRRAGVAKGTFFAHFADKEILIEELIAARLEAELQRLEAAPPPHDLDGFIAALMPAWSLMTQERYVFDVIARHSTAMGIANLGPLAIAFQRLYDVISDWLSGAPFRTDVTRRLLAEGVQAFALQSMALEFCALHNQIGLAARLRPYLRAWLLPNHAAGTKKAPETGALSVAAEAA
ncbi:Transcriptional regulator, TetR family [Candidatus Rhodobacter oscarellae]|uniref:Transcriptional regulator, TetR family n=1 Tax=Candidatus Rhodobacter oscarellae TaxID=1675527 RepID=A0A0J9E2H3_9RHOB|nr:TetR/AcrR family transcriptional regulator [Candidatus Rhodobacter lobularis]KMW56930.1 Transcriptional regulator, TetR family [Candidatus Rhodobacter lobularis]